jgi:hypothetical protein
LTDDKAAAVERLLVSVEKFTVPLRMGDGVDEPALAELKSALTTLASAWKGEQMIPKRAAAVLTELYPAVEGCSSLYPDDQASRVLEEANELLDLVQACMIVG